MKRYLLLMAIVATACVPRVPQNRTFVDEYPPIFPLYADSIVIPPNIAPLNFILPDSMSSAVVVISNAASTTNTTPTAQTDAVTPIPALITIKGNDIRIPVKKWRTLCALAPATHTSPTAQATITVTVYHNNRQYKSLHWFVSPDSIDPYIVYRLVLPTDGVYQTISLNERELSTFKTRPIMSNTLTNGNCFNCHSFQNHNSDKMILQLRNPRGLLIKDENGTRTIIPPSITAIQSTKNNQTIPDENVAQSGLLYSSWHPTQDLIVFSAGGRAPVCFYMPAGEQYYYNQVETNSRLIAYTNTKKWQEITFDIAEYSYPTWHPDGQTLFFVRSTKKPAEEYPYSPEWLAKYSFDLCYMHYDTAAKKFADTIYTLAKAADFTQNLAWQQNGSGSNSSGKNSGQTTTFSNSSNNNGGGSNGGNSNSNNGGSSNGGKNSGQTATFSSNGIYGQTPESGGSFGAPRVSPDGTLLVATYSRHAGNPIRGYSVLVGVDMNTKQVRLLTEITDRTGRGDSWPSFSSNGKWLMFASKRIDGYYTQIWFAHMSTKTAEMSKPFPLPQKDGNTYNIQNKAYNLPEFVINSTTF